MESDEILPENNAAHESMRIDAVKKYKEIGIDDVQDLQEIVKLASSICQAPVALITFIDEDKQDIIAKVGIDADETPREVAFCNHTIRQNDLMIVADAQQNPNFNNNPFVKGNPHIRFYAGATLQSTGGYNVGSLCVLDFKPRSLSDHQQECLRLLSKQAVQLMELRLSSKKKK